MPRWELNNLCTLEITVPRGEGGECSISSSPCVHSAVFKIKVNFSDWAPSKQYVPFGCSPLVLGGACIRNSIPRAHGRPGACTAQHRAHRIEAQDVPAVSIGGPFKSQDRRGVNGTECALSMHICSRAIAADRAIAEGRPSPYAQRISWPAAQGAIARRFGDGECVVVAVHDVQAEAVDALSRNSELELGEPPPDACQKSWRGCKSAVHVAAAIHSKEERCHPPPGLFEGCFQPLKKPGSVIFEVVIAVRSPVGRRLLEFR